MQTIYLSNIYPTVFNLTVYIIFINLKKIPLYICCLFLNFRNNKIFKNVHVFLLKCMFFQFHHYQHVELFMAFNLICYSIIFRKKIFTQNLKKIQENRIKTLFHCLVMGSEIWHPEWLSDPTKLPNNGISYKTLVWYVWPLSEVISTAIKR